MTLSLESATVAFSGSVDDILSSTLLPQQLKYPELGVIFRVVDGKTRVRMPREELKRAIDEIILNIELFPRKSALIIQGSSNVKNNLLSFVCTDPGLNTEQVAALKTYRNAAAKKTCEQQMALCRVRLRVEFYGGKFQLKSEVDQRFSVAIALLRE